MNHNDPEFDRMEEALKKALRRQQAPDAFANRVLARVAQQELDRVLTKRESILTFFTRPLTRWATATALATAMIVGGLYYRRAELKAERERAEGEAAKQQLVLALRIAGSKLQLAKSKVKQIDGNENSNRQVKE